MENLYNIYYILDGRSHSVINIPLAWIRGYVNDILTRDGEITGIISANKDT